MYADEYIDLKVLKASQIASVTTYANSHICFHKNIIGYSWYWDDSKDYVDVFGVYIPGFLYKVRDLGIAYSTKHSLVTNKISTENKDVQKL